MFVARALCSSSRSQFSTSACEPIRLSDARKISPRPPACSLHAEEVQLGAPNLRWIAAFVASFQTMPDIRLDLSGCKKLPRNSLQLRGCLPWPFQ